jgi:hypothetical protein
MIQLGETQCTAFSLTLTNMPPCTSAPVTICSSACVGGIFCDLAKAFDCVNHEISLAKLHFYGIQGVTADCFKSYLTIRGQKVEIKSCNATQNFFSDWGTLKHGVPQGSFLGPLLFVIYINNLPRKINSISKPILFADDTSVIICNRNLGDFCTVANLVLTRMIE